MIQLTYQAALDAYHGVFRLLRLRETFRQVGPVSIVQARIADFYLLFPFLVSDFRLGKGHAKFRKLGASYAHVKPYGEMPESSALFMRMQPIQLAAIETLATQGLIAAPDLARAEILVTDASTPDELAVRIREANERQADLMDFLRSMLTTYPVSGLSGIKARSGLMEYRYDAI